jgi:hypothetical protein
MEEENQNITSETSELCQLRYQNNVEGANRLAIEYGAARYSRYLDQFYYHKRDADLCALVVNLLNKAHESDDFNKLKLDLEAFVDQRHNLETQTTLLPFNVISNNDDYKQDYVSFRTSERSYYLRIIFSTRFKLNFSKKSDELCKLLINLMVQTNVADHRIIYFCKLNDDLLFELYKQLKTVDPFEYVSQNLNLIFLYSNDIESGNWAKFVNLNFVVIKGEKIVDYLQYYANREGELKDLLRIQQYKPVLDYAISRELSATIDNLDEIYEKMKGIVFPENYEELRQRWLGRMRNVIKDLVNYNNANKPVLIIEDQNKLHNLIEVYLPNEDYKKILATLDDFDQNTLYRGEKVWDIVKRAINFDEITKEYKRIKKEIANLQERNLAYKEDIKVLRGQIDFVELYENNHDKIDKYNMKIQEYAELIEQNDKEIEKLEEFYDNPIYLVFEYILHKPKPGKI